MQLTEILGNTKKTLFSIEILPPLKGRSIQSIYDSIDPLMEFKPAFVDVTYHREEYVYRKMPNGFLVRIMTIQIAKCAAKQFEQFGLAMIALGTEFDQFHEVGCCLGPRITASDSGERIAQDDFGQRVQIRFAAGCDLDFRFKKQVELSGKRTLQATRASRHGLDAAEIRAAPRYNQTRIAKLAFPQENRTRALHHSI